MKITQMIATLQKWIDKLPWMLVLVFSMVLGLAPFQPEPHLFEKTRMLMAGTLSRPIDIFDLFLHGAFPFLLIVKVVFSLIPKSDA